MRGLRGFCWQKRVWGGIVPAWGTVMSEIFISYKKEDLKRVEPIARALAQAGYDVWWDHRIPPGRTYREVIGAALQNAKCVIVVWSNLSASAQWVLDEADEGKKRNVLLPLLIDEVEIPYGFRQIEAARLLGWEGDVAHPEWLGVLDAIAHFVGRRAGGPPRSFTTPSAAPSAPRRAEASAPPRKSIGAGPLIALAAVLALGAGGFWAWRAGMFGGAREAPALETASAGDAAVSDAPAAGDAPETINAAAPPASASAPQPVIEAPPPPAALRAVRVNTRDTREFRRLSGGAWVEVGPNGVPRYRFSAERRDDRGIVLFDESRGVRLRVNDDASGIDGFDQERWVRFLDASGVERGEPRPPSVAGAPTEGVTRIWFSSGGMLYYDQGVWAETDPATGFANGHRWREARRDGDTIWLSDPPRDAGARVELGEGWIYLSLPDWGEYRRHWRIRAVDREF